MAFRSVTQQAGIALITVLCVIALITALAVAALSAARSRNLQTRRTLEVIQQSEYADSAIRVMLYRLISRPHPTATASMTVGVFGHSIPVEMSPESGRIDLNTAPAGLLVAAFAAEGTPLALSRAMASRIMDWRDVDDDVMPGGAERETYRAVKQPGSPRNAPFETVNELRSVLGGSGFTDEFLNRFTVYTQSAAVQNTSATADVAKIIAWAKSNTSDWQQWIGESVPARSASIAAGDVVRLQACAPSSVVHVCRRAIVRLTGNPRSPSMVYAWDTVYP